MGSAVPSPEASYLKGGEPFTLQARDSEKAVICIHGFSASPYEVKPVAIALHDAGLHVMVPAIVGHAIDPEKQGMAILRETTWNDWLEPLKKLVIQTRKEYELLYAYGQSMGGALALALAEEKLVDKVAVTGAAIQLSFLARLFSPLLGKMDRLIKKRTPRNRHFQNISYTTMSTKAIRQLVLLGKHVRKHLHEIRCPILVIHSKNDKTVPAGIPGIIKNGVTDARLDIEWFNDSGHTYP
ncbi:alpha/beta fold hydrolase, partial [Candidatus Bathyarchaeota archaeon]|nr:alpha/beta fold hydrolase [Candidatus Bathyarchaeota archaeon]